MELQVNSFAGHAASKLDVSDQLFNCEFNESLVHQVVTAYMAGGRQGTKQQKNRSDVQGGGAKPWRQKGTGRARAGTIRSPLWRKGGVTFAARPRDHSQKVNKRMYRQALQSILSEMLRQERLLIVQEVNCDTPKTKDMIAKLKELDLQKVMIVLDQENKNVALSLRNVPHISVVLAAEVDPVQLVAAEKVLMTVEAVKKLEERLA